MRLTEEVFDKMWKRVESGLAKTRYFIPYNERTIELDIYGGRLFGHAVAEVEFRSEIAGVAEEEAMNFAPPAWFGKEVTEDRRYRNKALAENGFPEGD